jgi:hypothetical protein
VLANKEKKDPPFTDLDQLYDVIAAPPSFGTADVTVILFGKPGTRPATADTLDGASGVFG